MALFTIDRTINFNEQKVKGLIKIIKESDSVEQIEDKMIENGIVSLMEDTDRHGFFRRRWITFLKEFGLYDGEKLTELADLYGSEELSTKEFVLLFLINHVVENNGEVVRPLELLLRITEELHKRNSEVKITETELKRIINKGDTSYDKMVENIILFRTGKLKIDETEQVPPCHYDIWRNLLKTAEISNNDSNEIEINLNLPIVKKIINYYDNNKPVIDNNSSFNSRFVGYIALPKKVNENTNILLRRQNYKDFYSKIIYNYLFEKSINNIEREDLNAAENGNIPFEILNGFNISTSRFDNPSNMKLYSSYKGYENIIINKLRKTGDVIYSFIASSIKNYLDSSFNSDDNEVIENVENPIEMFKKYYIDNLEKYKNDKEIQKQIELRKEYVNEYPISRIRKLTIDEYALGTDNYKETLSHKLEFGKYSSTGCGIGGGTSSKYGFYKRGDGNYYGRKNEIIDNPKDYWNEFIVQLGNYYDDCKDIEEPLRASSKYPLLKGMNMVLTKVSFLYYPTKFVSISSKQKLQKLMNYFGYEYNKKMQAEELSFLLNKNLRNDIKELSKNDPQIMGDILWDYLNEVIDDNIDEENEEGEEMAKGDVIVINQDRLTGGYNKIVYGIPGCGKSYYVKNTIINSDKNKGRIFTTTFYPDYSNGDFIGQIIPKLNNKDESSVLYDIQTGPFVDALFNAVINPGKNTYLVVEEINRGNAAAIFGDMFQLLDRDENGTSQYSIKNYLISTYLHKMIDNKYAVEYDLDDIKIPSNLVILGTMNTSDQNVFTLDTAFKRRWKMEYIKNDVKKSEFANEIIPLSDVTWAKFVDEINDFITSDNGLDVNGEDKQIGAYFVSSTEWKEIKEASSSKEAAKIFAEKVLSYLWEDVAKINKDAWFDKDKYRTLDSLVTSFMEIGLSVFSDNISFTREQNNEE